MLESENKIICPSCSAVNAQGKKFCVKCGSKLTAAEPEKKSVPVKNTVIQNTDKSSSRPVFADKPHANVPSETAAVTAKNKINLKIYCAVIIAVLLILAGVLLILNLGSRDSEARTNITVNDKPYNAANYTSHTEESVFEITTTVQTTSTESLTESAKWTETKINKTMYIRTSCYCCAKPIIHSETVGRCKTGQKVKIIAVTDTGFYKLSDGTYIYTDFAIEENPAESTVSDAPMSEAEKRIKILEDYYNKKLKNITKYDGYNIIGVNDPKIYDLTGNGEVIMLCEAKVRIEDDILDRSITLGCTVDSAGTVSTEKIIDNTGGGVSFQSIEIKKCSVNNKFYYNYYQHGAAQFNSNGYVSFDGSEDLSTYMFGVDRLYYVDGYPVTESSYENFCSYLESIMSEPVPTRKDGDISVYIQNALDMNNNKISVSAEIVPPENFKAVIIDGSNIRFSWDKVGGDDIVYTVYEIKNGKYTKVLDTDFTESYLIDGEKTDYCVTSNSDSRYISESGYSNSCTVIDNNFDSYSAIDFIGVEFSDLYEYSCENGGYISSAQAINCFWIDGIPYKFYGELVDYINGNVTDNYVRGIEIEEGDRVDGDIIFDSRTVKKIAEKYHQSKAVLEVEGAEGGGLMGINVKINIGDNRSAVIMYDIPYDSEYYNTDFDSFEESEAYYNSIIKKYDNKTIAINDVEAVFGTYARKCKIIIEDVYLY